MYNIDKIDGLTSLTVTQMEEADGGVISLETLLKLFRDSMKPCPPRPDPRQTISIV